MKKDTIEYLPVGSTVYHGELDWIYDTKITECILCEGKKKISSPSGKKHKCPSCNGTGGRNRLVRKKIIRKSKIREIYFTINKKGKNVVYNLTNFNTLLENELFTTRKAADEAIKNKKIK